MERVGRLTFGLSLVGIGFVQPGLQLIGKNLACLRARSGAAAVQIGGEMLRRPCDFASVYKS